MSRSRPRPAGADHGHSTEEVQEIYGSDELYSVLIDRFTAGVNYPGLDLSHIWDDGDPARAAARAHTAAGPRSHALAVAGYAIRDHSHSTRRIWAPGHCSAIQADVVYLDLNRFGTLSSLTIRHE